MTTIIKFAKGDLVHDAKYGLGVVVNVDKEDYNCTYDVHFFNGNKAQTEIGTKIWYNGEKAELVPLTHNAAAAIGKTFDDLTMVLDYYASYLHERRGKK